MPNDVDCIEKNSNMKQKLILPFLIVAAINLTACTTPIDSNTSSTGNTSTTAAEIEDHLYGKWEGILTSKEPEREPLILRLNLDSVPIEIFQKNSITREWNKIMPNHFRGSAFRGNAVIDGTHSGSDEDGTWVETWVMVVTCQSKDDLVVEWVRLVNNIDLPSSNLGKTFSSSAVGVLKRIESF